MGVTHSSSSPPPREGHLHPPRSHPIIINYSEVTNDRSLCRTLEACLVKGCHNINIGL